MMSKGYTNVSVLRGGFNLWKQYGYPTESGGRAEKAA